MRILLAEDDKTLADGLCRYLEQDGHRVTPVTKGGDLLASLATSSFDILILDLGLPDIDGFEVLSRLRKEPNVPPILILTARDSVPDRVKGLDLGADDYMIKPIALAELAARIRVIGRRQKQEIELQYGPLVIDLATRSARLAGTPLDITVREWSVLHILMTHSDQAVKKDKIVAALADSGDAVSHNAVEVYVSRLRQKLEPSVQIRTIRGFGYMLESQ